MLGTAPEDFRRYHPGGKLGSKLLHVADLMHTGDALPVVAPDTPMAEAVVVMSEKSFGVAVVAEDGIIKGVISDGDLRRNVSRRWHSTASDIATPLPVLIRTAWLAADAVGLMTSEGVTADLVEDDVRSQVGRAAGGEKGRQR